MLYRSALAAAGLLLLSMFVIYVLATAILRPSLVGGGKDKAAARAEDDDEAEKLDPLQVWGSALAIIFVITAVLGGIWFGVFTPTEGAGAGAFIGIRHLFHADGFKLFRGHGTTFHHAFSLLFR